MISWLLALGIALFFAMNIGASGAAAAMGSAYGAGVVSKKLALVLVAAGTLAGAVLGGEEVTRTISDGIIPNDSITVTVAIIVLSTASGTLFFANLRGIPLSTSEVTIGALVGVGLARGSLVVSRLPGILLGWVALPVLAFGITALLKYLVYRFLDSKVNRDHSEKNPQRFLATMLLIAGSYEAVAAGTNNVANAVGPIIGTDLISSSTGLFLGGIFVGLGALLWGGRVLETNGKKLTELSLTGGILVSFTTGSLVMAASSMGLPVPLTQATTAAIIGIGFSQGGFRVLQRRIVHNILEVWVLSPVLSLVSAYFGTLIILGLPSPYSPWVMALVAVIVCAYLTWRSLSFLALSRDVFSTDA